MEAYCLKCRTKREMQDAKPITMKNGKPATQGVCPECGTKMFKIGAGDAAKAEDAKAGAKATATADAPAKAPATRARAASKKS